MSPNTWMALSGLVVFASFVVTIPLAFHHRFVPLIIALVVAALAMGGTIWGFTEASRDNCERLGFGRTVADCREYTVTIRTPNSAPKEIR